MAERRTVNIIVTGPVGCGKSAIVEEIHIALKALGLEVAFADPRAVQSERNMVGDHQDGLDLYRDGIRVEVGEVLFTESQIMERVGGSYELPDRPGFWIDAPVAREIALRALGTSPSSKDRLRPRTEGGRP